MRLVMENKGGRDNKRQYWGSIWHVIDDKGGRDNMDDGVFYM